MLEFDVIVLGTGAAGLTAAITAHENGAKVGVFEKADLVGGTSAWSGGQVWIPNNPHMKDHGIEDSPERAVTYMMSLSHGLIERHMAEAYVAAGPEMVTFLEGRTPVQFYSVKDFPDYHPEFPGGSMKGGRTIECSIYPYDELGEWAKKVTPSPYYPSPHVTMSETPLGTALPKPPSEEELKRRAIRNERGCGQALVGRLLRACLDRGIEPYTEHRARDLIVEGGQVAGVIFETPKGKVTVRAKRGVILATGGFEWNDELVRAFLRGPMSHPVSVKTNTGDGLRMAMKAGAAIGNMREAWWMPSAVVPEEENSMGRMMISSQRAMPHSIMVNKRGKRFTNEAANYNAFGNAFHVVDVAKFEYVNLPCWLVFDQTYVERFGFGVSRFITPGNVANWVMRADTVAGLSEKLGIPAGALEATIAQWNEYAEKAHDPDFHRGESAYDTWWGDPNKKGTPQATFGKLTKGPYYACEVKSGTLGTKGGPKTDTNGQVIDIDGEPIPGLYAAGNVMASPFGMTYGGPGGTLGPGMVFGYLSGRHAAQRQTNL
jgi:succinate dehydrogenase/fumarate reductase flavoprotein subunit